MYLNYTTYKSANSLIFGKAEYKNFVTCFAKKVYYFLLGAFGISFERFSACTAVDITTERVGQIFIKLA